MTRADVAASMLETDPDPNVGADEGDFLGDAGLDRAPDITGTVRGIDRGMATHLPQDIGRDGFQIEEPEASGDPRALAGTGDKTDDASGRVGRRRAAARGRLGLGRRPHPGRPPDVDSRDEALDATRRLE
jgi:hypothetical protein